MEANSLYQNIGHFLTLSNSLDLCVNSCFENFVDEVGVLDKLQQESFDFKCKRMSHYICLFWRLGEISSDEKDKLMKKLEGYGTIYSDKIRTTRNYLAHSIVLRDENNQFKVVSSKRFKEGAGAINSMSKEQVFSSLEVLKNLADDFNNFSGDLQATLAGTKVFIDYGKREFTS